MHVDLIDAPWYQQLDLIGEKVAQKLLRNNFAQTSSKSLHLLGCAHIQYVVAVARDIIETVVAGDGNTAAATHQLDLLRHAEITLSDGHRQS